MEIRIKFEEIENIAIELSEWIDKNYSVNIKNQTYDKKYTEFKKELLNSLIRNLKINS